MKQLLFPFLRKRNRKNSKSVVEFFKAIASPELEETSIDLVEVALDYSFIEGWFQSLPVLQFAVAGVKTGLHVRDYFFLRKVGRFFWTFKDVPECERRAFAERLGENEAERERAGENLILLLERLDDMRKPEMVGRVFKAFLNEEITRHNAFRLCDAIAKMNLLDVPALVSYYREGTDISDEQKYALANAGLLTVLLGKADFDEGGSTYKKNQIAEQLIDIALAD